MPEMGQMQRALNLFHLCGHHQDPAGFCSLSILYGRLKEKDNSYQVLPDLIWLTPVLL